MRILCYRCGGDYATCDCLRFTVCECRFSGDIADASDCPVHGPDGELAREQKARDAADEAAYWPEWEGF